MSPERFRVIVSTVLIVGVGTAGTLIAIGFAGALVVGWTGSLVGAGPDRVAVTDFSGLVAGLVALRPIALAQAGLVVLIATPVLRVAASVVAFAVEEDRLYAAITLIVLGILLVSLFALR